MAENSGDRGEREDSGSKDRATVALVDAKVDGLRELIRAEFASVREDVRPLGDLVVKVALHGTSLLDHEKRLNSLEGKGKERGDYRRITLPAQIFAAVAAIIGIVELVLQLH